MDRTQDDGQVEILTPMRTKNHILQTGEYPVQNPKGNVEYPIAVGICLVVHCPKVNKRGFLSQSLEIRMVIAHNYP